MAINDVDIIYCDARALQDPDYRFRGVGQHSASLLAAVRDARSGRRTPRLIALVDPQAAPLDRIHEQLFDEIRDAPRRKEGGRGWFLSLSPMTHDPTWIAPFLLDETLHRIALFYDLIPLSIPQRYLRAAPQRIDYINALAWLRWYGTFAAISQFSGDALVAAMKIDPARVFVSGVAVRQRLEPATDEPPLPRSERRWIVVAGGGDPRKNPECALKAHARSDALRAAGVRLAVFGNYPLPMRQEFQRLYEAEGGRLRDLRFHNNLTDTQLHQLYREGVVTVVSSRAEGFSIPIVESSAAGTPVVVSDVGAHPELVDTPEARFDPDDPERLRAILEDLASSEDCWAKLQSQQADLWRRYTTHSVGHRFLEGVMTRASRVEAPTVLRRARPQVAVLSPVPPALSGVADYTAATWGAASSAVDLHLFTDTPDACRDPRWRSLQATSAASVRLNNFDAVVGVMGNSHHHRGVFEHLMAHGGACIAHDARQIDFYFHLLGPDRAAAIASAELGRSVTTEEVVGWLRNQRELPTLFLSEIAHAASPLFVHSTTTARLISELYDACPVLLPFAQYRSLPPELSDVVFRRSARQRIGVQPNQILLVSFGMVAHDKAPRELIWAAKLMTDWGYPVRLVFCGYSESAPRQECLDLATDLRIADRVVLFNQSVTEDVYVAHLAAADIGIQLRTYGLGGLSGALNDCIAAGLPSIANKHLAEAMLAPSFVRPVPDNLSSLLIAEAILSILESNDNRDRPTDAAQAFAADHTPERYAQIALNELGLEVSITPERIG